MPCWGCFRLDPKVPSSVPVSFSDVSGEGTLKKKKARAINTENVKKQLQLLPNELDESTYGLTIAGVTGRKYRAQDFFNFQEVIGSGSVGVVFKSEFIPDNSVVAVKFIPNFRQFKTSILRELTVFRIASNCKYLIRFHSNFRVGESLYFVTELGEGGSLHHLLEPNFSLPPGLARMYLKELSTALIYLHSKGIVHRDVCPNNTVLTKTGHLRLIDFGLCRTIEYPQGEMITDCGNAAYRAPEMYLDKLCSFSIDWWSMGILLYRFVTGYVPFPGTKLTQSFQSVTKLRIKFPEWLFEDPVVFAFCSGLLSKHPKDRLGHESPAQITEHPYFSGMDWDVEEDVEDLIVQEIRRHGFERYMTVFSSLTELLGIDEEQVMDLIRKRQMSLL